MDGRSLVIEDRRRDQLQALFPDVFTEGKLDWERLRAALGSAVETGNERYHLTWAGKSGAIRALQSPTTATLAPCREESVNFDGTDNLFIEGENLTVLKVLQKAYFGKIKMIYIDPPYNTGNDHFIYPDRFAESKKDYLKRVGDMDDEGRMLREGLFRKNSRENGHYHSNWLSMIYPRLFLARNLLRDDGVIFVSIDDNEAHNLRLVMNEIFGEENFVGALKRRASRKTAFLSKGMTDICDYVLVYSKETESVSLIAGEVEYSTRPVFNAGNKESIRIIKRGTEAKCADGSYRASVYSARSVKFSLLDTLKVTHGKVMNDCRAKGPFRINQDVMDKTLYVTKNVSLRRYLLPEEKDKGKLLNDLTDIPELYNEQGTEELAHLFGKPGVFNHPKPSNFIKYLIRSQEFESEEKDFHVLDFFAGSCPMAHAVLDLNKEDGGNRKFICVQMPETCDEKSEARKAGYATIADIGKERIRRVIDKLTKEPDKQPNLAESSPTSLPPRGIGFKVFKLRESNFKIWRAQGIQNEAELARQMEMHTDTAARDATPEALLYELLLKAGIPPTAPLAPQDGWLLVGQNEAALALERPLDEALIQAVISARPQRFITLDRLFQQNDQLKTNTALQLQDANIEFTAV